MGRTGRANRMKFSQHRHVNNVGIPLTWYDEDDVQVEDQPSPPTPDSSSSDEARENKIEFSSRYIVDADGFKIKINTVSHDGGATWSDVKSEKEMPQAGPPPKITTRSAFELLDSVEC